MVCKRSRERTAARLRARAVALPTNDPATKRVLAELAAAQAEYAEAWREIVNADPLTRVLTDPAFADAALARARREVTADGGALLAYMLGRGVEVSCVWWMPNVCPNSCAATDSVS